MHLLSQRGAIDHPIDQAAQLGFVGSDEVAMLADEVQALVAQILTKPRSALALGKALFYRQIETGIAAAYADAQHQMACNMMDDCALDGVQAFIDKPKRQSTP